MATTTNTETLPGTIEMIRTNILRYVRSGERLGLGYSKFLVCKDMERDGILVWVGDEIDGYFAEA